MKPLTIEQLKALEVGDWVWVTSPHHKQDGMYLQKYGNDEFFKATTTESIIDRRYSDYDKIWLAWKNKEQADDKCVELLCRVGDTVYIPWVWDGESDVATLIVECIVMKDDGEDFWLCLDLETADYEFIIKYRNHLMSDYGKTWFTDKSEAERRLAELTKE